MQTQNIITETDCISAKAFAASFASHKRIFKINKTPFEHSLIVDEALQLIESPIIEPPIESFTFPNLSYSFQIFHNNNVCVIDNLSAYIVVNPSHETSLPATQRFQSSLGGLSAFGF